MNEKITVLISDDNNEFATALQLCPHILQETFTLFLDSVYLLRTLIFGFILYNSSTKSLWLFLLFELSNPLTI